MKVLFFSFLKSIPEHISAITYLDKACLRMSIEYLYSLSLKTDERQRKQIIKTTHPTMNCFNELFKV